MALPHFTMSDLLAAGVHFGHRDFRWNPRLKSYIYGTRNGIHIFDLTQTLPLIYTALAAVEATVARGGRVLFVGTKRQAQSVVVEAAERCGMYYVNHRWLGGLLTNWKTVNNSTKRLRELDDMFAQNAAAQEQIAALTAAATPENPFNKDSVKDPMGHLTKKERLMNQRERTNLNRALGGIKTMAGLPDLVVVLSVHQDHIAVAEANCLGIPVIGVVDSNATDQGVTYVIPGNDDSSRALGLYARLISEAVLSGIAMQAQSAPAADGSITARAPRGRSATVTLSTKAQAAANQAEAEAVAAEAPKAPEAPAAALAQA